MEPQIQLPEFVCRRLLDAPPDWSVWVPVGFAVFVVYLIALFRQEKKSAASLLLPAFVLVLGLAALAGHLLFESFPWQVFAPAALALVVAYMAAMFSLDASMRSFLVPLAVIAAVGVAYAIAGLQIFLGLFSWLYLLGPTLGIALFYVGMMYFKDARSVHPGVAGFLGFLRCLVYVILTAVFLLPGCQTFETHEQQAKIAVLFDASGSMVNHSDDVPELNQDLKKNPLLKRQDKVIRFLTERKKDSPTPAFLEAVLAKSPITAYRFGSMLDETDVQAWKASVAPTNDALRTWLKPNRDAYVPKDGLTADEQAKRKQKYQDTVDSLLSNTNIGGSALQFAKLEGNNYLQYVLVFSDGQNNLGSDDSLREFVNRMSAGKRKVPIIVVGVGEDRLPASIIIDDLQAPASARPDDKFPVRVPVIGSGLGDEVFDVILEARRIKDGAGKPLPDEKTYQFPVKKGKFQGAGDFPKDLVEFEVDVQKLKDVKVADDKEGVLEGTWQFVAKVPKHAREGFEKAEHVSEIPTEVIVQKGKLRVLLFAGGPTREYQFLRTLLNREVNEERMHLSVYLQTGKDEKHVDQEVEPERLLRNFPTKLVAEPGDKYMSLSEYDVVICIDPDWLALDVAQYKLLRDWVDKDAGGVVFVAGPVHTYQLKRPAGVDISALQTLLPVFLKDSRLHGLGGIGHDTSRPYALNFTEAAKLYDFLRLEEDATEATAGWSKFFWDGGVKPAERDARPKRGIFNYYPVEKVKGGAKVVATFAGPDSSRINDGKDEQPFMVQMNYGSGKSLYVGSAETWRLRHAKDGYHERFWIKLCRYMSSGMTQQKKYGTILLPRTVSVGNISFEAQIKGKNFLPLPADERPKVIVRRLDSKEAQPDDPFELKAKPTQGQHNGWFVGNYPMKEPGEYEFVIPIPGVTEPLKHKLTVRKPNPEADNYRINFGLLYKIASDAKETLDTLPPELRKKISGVLQPVEGETRDAKQGPKLFFRLDQAESVVELIKQLSPKSEQTKGRLEDLWDQGAETGWSPSAYHLAWATPLIVGVLGAIILLIFGQYLFAALFMAVGAMFALIPVVYDLIASPAWRDVPVNFSFVLVTIVLLLGTEWLMRKLLKLA